MVHGTRVVAVGLCVYLACSGLSQAHIATTNFDVSGLTQKADLIVAGQLGTPTDVRTGTIIRPPDRTIPGRIRIATLNIASVLKGPMLARAILVEFFTPSEDIGYANPTQEYRMYFLRGVRDHYEYVDPYWPSVVAIPGAPVSGGTAMERVANALAAVLRSPLTSSNEKRSAIVALRSTDTPASFEGLRVAAGASAPEVGLLAVGALLRKGDTAMLSTAVAALERIDPATRSEPDYISNLRVGIRIGVRDARSAPLLRRLMGSRNVADRRAAVGAFKNIGSPSVLPDLIAALDDSDEFVRFTAEIGLAEIARRPDKMIARDAFASDPGPTVEFWKAWGRAQGIRR